MLLSSHTSDAQSLRIYVPSISLARLLLTHADYTPNAPCMGSQRALARGEQAAHPWGCTQLCVRGTAGPGTPPPHFLQFRDWAQGR